MPRKKYPEIGCLIGKQLRKIRTQKLKLGLQEAASCLKISHQQLRQYETGKGQAYADTVFLYATITGLPIQAFFPKQKDLLLAPATLECARTMVTLLPVQRQALLGVMDSIKATTEDNLNRFM